MGTSANDCSSMRTTLEKEDMFREDGTLVSEYPSHGSQVLNRQLRPYTSSIPLRTSQVVLKQEVSLSENHRLHSSNVFSNASSNLNS